MGKIYKTVKNFALDNKKNRCWPDSENSIWSVRHGVPGNGFSSAFINMGRRVLIDVEEFWECLERLKEKEK